MTIAEMHRRINLRLQKIDSGAYDNVLPEEIDEYINLAQERFIKKRFEPRSNKFGLGFEQSIKRIEDLRSLIPEPIELEVLYLEFYESPITGIHVDVAKYGDCKIFLPVSVGCEIQYNKNGIEYSIDNHKRVAEGDYGTKRIQSNFVQQNDLYAVLNDPFNKPRINRSIFTLSDDGIILYTDDTFIVNKVYLTYIRQPKKVSLSDEVDSEIGFPEEITDDAIRLILSDIEAFGPEGKLMALTDSE